MAKIIADISVRNSLCLPGITYEQFVAGLHREDYDFIRYEPGTDFSRLKPNPLLAKKEFLRVTYVGSKNWSIHARVSPPDDPRVFRLLEYLKQLGMVPRPMQCREKPGMYHFWLLREYEQEDFDKVEFFEFRPSDPLGGFADRSSLGRLTLKKSQLGIRNYLVMNGWSSLAVSADMREKMEKAGLKRLIFRETEAGGEILKDEKNQIWELDSDLVLPPFSSKCDCRDLDGKPFTGDYSRGFTLTEGFYIAPEFHYTRSVIKSVGEFDLARTHEHWGTEKAPRKLVCSRRFYEFCNAHKVKMKWFPVRIDED